MNLLSNQGKYSEIKGWSDIYVPKNELKAVLMKIISSNTNNLCLINKYSEYLEFNDILFFTWKMLPSVTAKCTPNEVYVLNYLNLFEKLQINSKSEAKNWCGIDNSVFFTFDENITKRCLNKVWQCMINWEYTTQTHRQLMIILLEKVLIYLEKPLPLIDFLMDSLDSGGSISLLALQGIFTITQQHNLNYPNIFAKLYSMFEPKLFDTRYKPRLFYLSDLFLRSTHLPQKLVAAFVKRLARLALSAPSGDIVIICKFIGNLLIRHPGLKVLLHNPHAETAAIDPYIMEETDPLKSNAVNSSLWELKTLQYHVQPSVANAARFINSPLPSLEWDIEQILEIKSEDIFNKEIKKYRKCSGLLYDQPKGLSLVKGEKLAIYWDFA